MCHLNQRLSDRLHLEHQVFRTLVQHCLYLINSNVQLTALFINPLSYVCCRILDIQIHLLKAVQYFIFLCFNSKQFKKYILKKLPIPHIQKQLVFLLNNIRKGSNNLYKKRQKNIHPFKNLQRLLSQRK